MAIAFARMVITSAAEGKTALGTSCYISARNGQNPETADRYNFGHANGQGPERVAASFVLLPEGADVGYYDPDKLWTAAEKAEHRAVERYSRDLPYQEKMRARIQYAKHLIIALPRDAEVSPEQRIEMAREFAQLHFVDKGVAVEVAVHVDDPNNPHAHLLITTRRFTEDGLDFANKARDLNPVFRRGRVAQSDEWMLRWHDFQTAYFKREGIQLEVDAISVVPQQHMGAQAAHGVLADICEKRIGNAESRATAREIIRTYPYALAEAITRTSPAFTEKQVARELFRQGFSGEEFDRLKAAIIAHPDVVPLYTLDGRHTGTFTTAQVRANEFITLAHAKALAEAEGGGLDQSLLREVSSDLVEKATRAGDPGKRPNMDLLEYVAGDGKLKQIVGLAGSGKTTNIEAIHEAYSRAGYEVRGVAPTHAAVANLKEIGMRAETVANMAQSIRRRETILDEFISGSLSDASRDELIQRLEQRADYALKSGSKGAKRRAAAYREAQEELRAGRSYHPAVVDTVMRMGRSGLTRNSVLVMDEAGMVPTADMAVVLGEARRADAKVVLIGDNRQIKSIMAGRPFQEILHRHGGFTLSDIFRQRDLGDRAASKAAAFYDFKSALAHYDAKGAILLEKNVDAARKALVGQWHADSPLTERRVIIASTNEDIFELNRLARLARLSAGEIQLGAEVQNKSGKVWISEGDRILTWERLPAEGIEKNQFGTIVGVNQSAEGATTIQVQFDGARGEGGPVEIDIDRFRDWALGYATTTYRMQGATVDRTYMLHRKAASAEDAYVKMTRHRDRLVIAASKRETFDVVEMAQQMSRSDNRLTTANYATAGELEKLGVARRGGYHIDQETIALEFGDLSDQDRAALQNVLRAYDQAARSRVDYIRSAWGAVGAMHKQDQAGRQAGYGRAGAGTGRPGGEGRAGPGEHARRGGWTGGATDDRRPGAWVRPSDRWGTGQSDPHARTARADRSAAAAAADRHRRIARVNGRRALLAAIKAVSDIERRSPEALKDARQTVDTMRRAVLSGGRSMPADLVGRYAYQVEGVRQGLQVFNALRSAIGVVRTAARLFQNPQAVGQAQMSPADLARAQTFRQADIMEARKLASDITAGVRDMSDDIGRTAAGQGAQRPPGDPGFGQTARAATASQRPTASAQRQGQSATAGQAGTDRLDGLFRLAFENPREARQKFNQVLETSGSRAAGDAIANHPGSFGRLRGSAAHDAPLGRVHERQVANFCAWDIGETVKGRAEVPRPQVAQEPMVLPAALRQGGAAPDEIRRLLLVAYADPDVAGKSLDGLTARLGPIDGPAEFAKTPELWGNLRGGLKPGAELDERRLAVAAVQEIADRHARVHGPRQLKDAAGRTLDPEAVRTAVAQDPVVATRQTEIAGLLQEAYRDPDHAAKVLQGLKETVPHDKLGDEIARRPEILGDLKGNPVWTASAADWEEHRMATSAAKTLADRVGPLVEAESNAAKVYEADVRKAIAAEAQPLPPLSQKAAQFVELSTHKNAVRHQPRLEAWLSRNPAIAREIDAFSKAAQNHPSLKAAWTAGQATGTAQAMGERPTFGEALAGKAAQRQQSAGEGARIGLSRGRSLLGQLRAGTTAAGVVTSTTAVIPVVNKVVAAIKLVARVLTMAMQAGKNQSQGGGQQH